MIVNGVEIEPNWIDKPRHPIRIVLTWLCGKQPPHYVKGYDYSNLTEQQHEDLQQWVVLRLDKTPLFWSTGIGVIEAAQRIVEEAVSNGNIPAKDSKWRVEGITKKMITEVRNAKTKKRRSPRRNLKNAEKMP